jgi:hypothetical protein
VERLLLPLSVRARMDPGFHLIGQGNFPAQFGKTGSPSPILFPLLLKEQGTNKIVRDPLGLPILSVGFPTPLSSGISPSHSR